MSDFVVRPGVTVGRWTVQKQLGQGHFGAAFRAVDADGRVGALKVIDERPGPEVRALAGVCHPCIPTLLDSGASPVNYLVMELVAGRALSARLRAAPVGMAVAIDVVANIADALAAVHHAGLHHGDVKPDNILVTSSDDALYGLVDFGLAGRATGGTLRYAAPECLAGKPNSPVSDVYSLGLVLWELIHGRRPWSELDLGQALHRRRHEVPPIESGEPWLRELLARTLIVEPSLRPSAAEVADTLSAHGARVREPDAALLRRRSQCVHVWNESVDNTVEGWFETRGHIAFVGESGSGRTHQLDRLTRELRVRGVPHVRFAAAREPWAVVALALRDPSLPGAVGKLPKDPDPTNRGEAAAEALEARSPGPLVVVVDDLDMADQGTLLTLHALHRRRLAHICAAGSAAPEWPARVVRLAPFDEAALRDLTSQLLGGDANLEPLVRRLVRSSGGLPAVAANILCGAADRGVIARRRQRWLVDPDALDTMLAEGGHEAGPAVDLPPAARTLGAYLAVLGRPQPLDSFVASAPLPAADARTAVASLLESGLARMDGNKLCCRSAAAMERLIRCLPDTESLSRHALESALSEPGLDLATLGRHIIGARDSVRAREFGARVVEAVAALDFGEAARVADGLWAIAPGPELVEARVRALGGAGRSAEAQEAALAFLDGRPTGSADVGVLTALADLLRSNLEDPDAALAQVRAAHAALGDAPVPPSLVAAEANVHFAAGRTTDAIAVARTPASAPPPLDPAELDCWLRLRGVWAQALDKQGDTTEAIAILDLPDIPVDVSPARALLEGIRGRLMLRAGRLREAAAAMKSASAVGTGLSAMERARMTNDWGLASRAAGDRVGALASWEDALILFERLRSPLEQIRVSINLCAGYQDTGRWERARQAGQWAFDESMRRGHPELAAVAIGNVGDVCLGLGSFDEAERHYATCTELSVRLGLRDELVELARRQAELGAARDAPDALDLARRARDMANEAGASVEAYRAEALMALALARRGQLKRVDHLLNRAIKALRDAGAAGDLARVRIIAAEAYLACGRTRDAVAECDRVAAYAQEAGLLPLRTRADQLTARARGNGAESAINLRLEQLLELASAMTRERDLPVLLTGVASAALNLLQADRAFVILGTAESHAVVASCAREGVETGRPSESVVHQVLTRSREVLAADIGERSDLRGEQSIRAMNLRSAMCVPLVEPGETLGAIYTDSRMESTGELTGALRLLRALASHAAAAVCTTRLLEEQTHRAERAAELAHDLRSPIAALITTARLLTRRDLPESAVAAHVRNVEALQRTIIEMLTHLIEAPAKLLTQVDVGAVLSQVGDMLAVEARWKGVALEVEVPEVRPRIHGDASELFRALANIGANAIKYSPSGGTIALTMAVSGDAIRIVVDDEGPGIPDTHHEAVFERGRQAPGARPGTGLGLAIASRVVTQHGGRVWAENRPEGGARLVIELPVAGRAGVERLEDSPS